MNLSKASIQPDDIIHLLKQDRTLKPLCQKILYRQVIERTARQRDIVVTPEEIQAEADRFRQENRLERASDTLAWLADLMITAEDWEAGIRAQLLEQKLADRLFEREVERVFVQTKIDYDRAILYQVVVSYEPIARELLYQIEDGEITFYEAARLYDIHSERRYRCGYSGQVERWSLPPSLAAAVFGATIGEPSGPIQTDEGYHLILVEEFIPAELTPARKQAIQNRLFKEWLDGELNYQLHAPTED